jgi:hypothetical protein
MTASPEAGATVVMGRAEEATTGRVSVLGSATSSAAAPAPVPEPEPKKRAGLWVAIAAVVLLALGGGGYYAMIPRGPDPEMAKARAAQEAAEAERQRIAEENEKLKAEKAAQEAKRKADEEARQKAEREAAIRQQAEDEARRKFAAEQEEIKKSVEETRRRAEEEEAAKRKIIEDARKATEFVAGDFDHFGKTLMMIGLKDRPAEIRLQGVDAVDDPALHKLAADSLASQPRNLRCRQTDRLTDGTPLYRCLITKRNAKGTLADIPDSDRDDLALVLVRTGLLLASCDAPRSYADAEDDARGSKQYLWGRVSVQDYKRRCSK